MIRCRRWHGDRIYIYGWLLKKPVDFTGFSGSSLGIFEHGVRSDQPLPSQCFESRRGDRPDFVAAFVVVVPVGHEFFPGIMNIAIKIKLSNG